MGFFSSRKTDASDPYLAHTANRTGDLNDRSVVHTLRYRLYGKNKGKERDESQASFYAGGSAAQTLSPSEASLRLQGSPSKSSAITRGFSLRIRHEPAPVPSTSKNQISSTLDSPLSPVHAWSRNATPILRSNNPDVSLPSSPRTRKMGDAASLTLAQRLNELATANAHGFLSDDEYRLLRQNLFERFSTTTAVPAESPVVPVLRSSSIRANIERKPRPLSNFQVEVKRADSVKSKGSIGSGMSGIFRLALNRRTPAGSRDYSETSSMVSTASKASNFLRRISRKSSNSSMHTTHGDAMSTSSRRTGNDRSIITDRLPHLTSFASRSTTSIRKLSTPPSSFPSRIMGNDAAKYSSQPSDIFDEEHPKSASELRQEIMAVETEARRLLDAFNGLEMTTLSKIRRRSHLQDSRKLSDSISSRSIVHDGHSQRRITIVDSDVVSTKSGMSAGTNPPMIRSPHSPHIRKTLTGKEGSSIGSGRLRRMNSKSSVSSQEHLQGIVHAVPSVPSLPSGYSQLTESSSNISSVRSVGQLAFEEHNCMEPGDKTEDETVEDIRQRRAEVSVRYERRLEYLRAQLKGAELHEKILRR